MTTRTTRRRLVTGTAKPGATWTAAVHAGHRAAAEALAEL